MNLHRFLAAGLLFTAACLAIFGAPKTAAWLGVGAGLAAWAPDPTRGRSALAHVLGLLWLGAAALGWPTPFVEYADRTEALLNQPTWSTRDRAGAWLLNVGMAIGGALVGFPEAALETTLLTVPDLNGDGKRTFSSDFPAGSARVRAELRAWRQQNPRGALGPLPPRRVAWRYDEVGWSEARYALALNSLDLRGTVAADPASGAKRLSVCAEVAVSYWPNTSLPLFWVRGRRVALEEGLYWRLQQEGWLFPYQAAWCWQEPWTEGEVD